MRKEEMQVLDYLLEALAIIGLVGYIILQIFYMAYFAANMYNVVYRVLTILLMFTAIVIAQFTPEIINIGSSEKLTGKVRILAIRMLRWMKLIIVYTLLIPSIADLAEHSIDEAYTLIAALLLLIDMGIYMYKIYKHNKNSQSK